MIANSGALEPNATTVKPMTKGGIFNSAARCEAPLTMRNIFITELDVEQDSGREVINLRSKDPVRNNEPRMAEFSANTYTTTAPDYFVREVFDKAGGGWALNEFSFLEWQSPVREQDVGSELLP